MGLPFMDQMRDRIVSRPVSLAESRGEKTVLLAPSWGPSGTLSVYGERIIEALLSTGYLLIVRPHPQSFTAEKELIEKLMTKYPDGEILQWNRDNDNFDVLSRADVLISDFSGVLFDFSLVFDKPVIYTDTSFDKGLYDCFWLDEELWTFKILPKIGIQLTNENLPQLKNLIDQSLEDPRFQKARDEARRETWQYPGEGAKRTVDYLMSKLNTLQQ